MGNPKNTGFGGTLVNPNEVAINDDISFNNPSYDPPCPPGVFVTNSYSISFSGSGSTCDPLTGSVILSKVAGNSIVIFSDGLYASGGTGAGAVTSVFGRTGIVSAQVGDYSAFYYSVSNPSGFINGITSGMINTALGYIPLSGVTISPNAGNIITNPGNGLYASGTTSSVTGANDGLTLSSGIIKLGQLSGTTGAALIDNREIPFNGNSITLDNPKFIYQTFDSNPVHTYVDATGYLIRASMNNTQQIICWEHSLDNNANGGPPNDLISVMGWNLDSHTNGTQPSWTDRWEYQYTGSFYEHHEQWSSPVNNRVYRLMSQTMVDHGSAAADLCLTFYMGTGFEWRTLYNELTFMSVGNSVNTDATTLTVNSTSSTVGIQLITDPVNNVATIASTTSTPNLVFSNWPIIFFGSGSRQPYIVPASSLLGINSFNTITGSVFSFDTAVDDMSFNYLLHKGNLFNTIISDDTGEWSDNFAFGLFRQFNVAGTNIVQFDSFGTTAGILPINITGSNYFNISSSGANNSINGAFGAAYNQVASVSPYNCMYLKNTLSTGASNLLMENNKGSFANYIEFIIAGSSSTLQDGLFGISSSRDWAFLVAGGGNNAGMLIGTLGSALVFGTNNIERARFAPGGNLLVGTASDDGVNLLQVNGGILGATIKLTTGAGSGKVLTSDASGNGTWQTPASGGGGTLSGVTNPITNTVGVVGLKLSTVANNSLLILGDGLYASGITSSAIISALGYTPYNASNPSGFISGITSVMVTNALGFTPASGVTNPITNIGGKIGMVLSATAGNALLVLGDGLFASGSTLQLLATGSTSSGATLDINMSTYYNLYSAIVIEFSGLRPSVDNTNLEVRVSTDGTTFDSGGTNYAWNYFYSGTSTVATTSAFIQIANGISNATTSECSGSFTITNQNQTTSFPQILGMLVGVASPNTQVFPICFAGTRLAAQLTKGFRFLSSSGTISGKYRVYGKK